MNNTISENLAFYRRKRNLTQKELAEKTGLSISFISHIENKVSEPSDENLKKIADALGVLPSDLKSDGDLKKIKNENIELVKLLIKLTREEKIKWDYDNDSSAWGWGDFYFYKPNNYLIYNLVYRLNVNNQLDHIYLKIEDEKNSKTTEISGDGINIYNYLCELFETINTTFRDKSPIFNYIKELEEIDKNND